MKITKVVDCQKTKKREKSAVSRYIENKNGELVLIKDQNYFNDFSWNNSYLASGKMYDLYHKQENDLKEKQNIRKEEMKTEELEAKNDYLENLAINNRYNALKSISKLAKMRKDLQESSSQPVHDKQCEGFENLIKKSFPPEALERIKENIVHEKHKYNQIHHDFPLIGEAKGGPKMLGLINRKPSMIWNQLNRLNSKNLDLLITPLIVKIDQKAFEEIQTRKIKEKEMKDIIAKRKMLVYDSIKKKKSNHQFYLKAEKDRLKTRECNRFINYDDADLNGLIMNDVLRIKGVTDCKIINKIMKSNPLLCHLKSTGQFMQTSQIGEKAKRNYSKPKEMCNDWRRKQFRSKDEFFKIDDNKIDFEGFEENLKKENKFKESRYPKINLDNLGRFVQK